MPGPERNFTQQKTCPMTDRGSRLASTPQDTLLTREQVTYGALATRHPLGVEVEGRKHDGLLHRVTTYEQVLVPIKRRIVHRTVSNSKTSKPCRPTNEIKAKQRRQERTYLEQVKGLR